VAFPSPEQGSQGLASEEAPCLSSIPHTLHVRVIQLFCVRNDFWLSKTHTTHVYFTWATDYKAHFNTLEQIKFLTTKSCDWRGRNYPSFHRWDTEAQRNGDQVQGRTHEDWRHPWFLVLCFLQCIPVSVYVPRRCMKGAYIHMESNAIHLKVVHTESSLSPRGKDEWEQENRKSKVESGRRKTWLRRK